jgi:PAS domain-containing protein
VPERLLKIPAIPERRVWGVGSVFDAFGVGMYGVDLDGRFTYLTPSGQELLGWDAEELLDRTIFGGGARPAARIGRLVPAVGYRVVRH